VIVGRVVIDAGGQARKIAADEIELQVVARSRAAGRAELDFPPGLAAPTLEQAVGTQAEPGNCLQVRDDSSGWYIA
jgi:hypothetical protein